MNQFIVAKQTLLDVACKSGLTSCKSVFKPWNPQVVPIEEFKTIVLVIREPRERLLSAWRMYFEGPSIKWLGRGLDVDYVRDARYIRKNAQNIIENPLRYWQMFLTNSLEDYQTDPHFAPQWREYRRFYLNQTQKIKLHNHDRLDKLFEQYGKTPVRENSQKWRWHNIDKRVFLDMIPQRVLDQYYIEDTLLWVRLDK